MEIIIKKIIEIIGNNVSTYLQSLEVLFSNNNIRK